MYVIFFYLILNDKMEIFLEYESLHNHLEKEYKSI